MHYKFTLNNAGRMFKVFPVLLMLLAAFAVKTTAQCTWTASTAYPVSTMDMPLATVGANMYGFSGVSGGAIVAASYKYDGTAWTAIAPLPVALESPSAVSNGTDIYIMGGANNVGTSVTTNYRYNVGTNTYTTLAPFTNGTWNHAAVFYNGKIYKIGGIAGTVPSAAVQIYDIAANTWSAGANLPAAAGFISAVEIGGFIYAAGGIDAAGTAKTYRYDPVANTWNDAAIADLPATRWGSAYGVYRGGFVLAGGYVGGDVGTNTSNTAISWNPLTNTWTSLPNMLVARNRLSGAVYNDSFYAIGGRDAAGGFVGSNNNQKLTCPPLLPCAGTPAPGNTFASPSTVCAGSPVALSVQNATAGTGVTYQWESSAAVGGPYAPIAGATNPTYSASPTVTTFYRLVVTCAATPGTSTPIQVTVTPCTCLSPDAATICEGAIQSITVVGAGVPGSQTASSGTIAVAVPDANAAGTTATLPLTLPAGASITSISVNLSLTHTWVSDMSINLIAPDGSVYNLVNARGGSGDNFTNTTISTSSTNSFATGAAPFTGTFAPDYALNVGPTAFLSTIANFAAFNKNQPSGLQNWRLALRDVAAGDLGTLTTWSITVNYNVLPTAVWTGGTFFTNAAATTPYVAGSSVNTVYVQPSTTTTYTATIGSGPCAGANPVTVTVLPRPVVTVSPATACGPVSITASGAATYVWSPSTGLSATTGATVNANPAATTTYSVIGTSNAGCASLPASAVVNSAPTASVISAVAGATFQVNESFSGTVFPPAGWAQQNLSAPIGTTNWFKPTSPAPFPAFSGAETEYAAANFNNGAGTATISNWLFSPVVNIKNGDYITFYTRTTDGTFPDRLQLRLSTSGTSVNVGTTATSTGDFGTLLVEVNPNLATGTGYPNTWTQFTGTVTGVTGTVQGRFAFRYFVTNGGTTGANSDFIGIDNVQYAVPATVNCANVVTNIKVDITGGVGPFTVVYSNGTTNTTIPNYVSGSNIQVSPAVTTNYTIVSVTGANGCVGTNNSGSAAITITPAAAITTQPASASACVGGNATFTVASTPVLGNTYQWQMALAATPTVFTDIPGATNATYTVNAATLAMSGNRYRVRVSGACGAPVNSAAATLTVNNPAVIATQPVNTSICIGSGSATFTVAATGGGLTYQWQVSPDGVAPFTNITNNANYSGATTATLTVSNATAAFANYRFRVNVSSGGCAAVTSSVVSLTANPTPVLTLSANPFTEIYPGQTTTLTVASTTNIPAGGYTWFQNGVEVPGATTNTLVVDIDEVGTYTVSANDVNTCTATSNAITITESANSILFIYPSPNTGQFQVRFFSEMLNTTTTRTLNIYDSKGARVYSRVYPINSPYTRMDVDIRRFGKGIYQVDLTDINGNRLKAGRVVVL